MQIEYKPLGEIAKIDISGVDKKTKKNETPVKLCNFIDVYHNWAITKNNMSDFMDATATTNEINRFSIKKGQIAITKDSETRDDIGISTYIADDFENVILGYHCVLITPNNEIINSKFLNAYLHSETALKYFEYNATGSGQRYTLTADSLDQLKVPIFDLDVQERIGDVFSILDRKIENNKLLIQELERFADTLFNYWFLQFEFPDINGQPFSSSGGKLVWNEKLKQKIPENWKQVFLKDLVDVITGKQDANFSTPLGKYPFFTCSNDISKCDEYEFEGKSILIAGNGDFNVKYYEGKFNAYQRTYILTPAQERYVGLIYHYAIRRINAFKNSSNGSIVKFITKGDVEDMEILIPNNLDLLNPFNTCLSKIISIKNEIEEINKLRDYLIPLLVSEQVKIIDYT